MSGIFARTRLATLLLLSTLVWTEAPLKAQEPGATLRSEFPELGSLFNAFDVTQAALYERVAEITNSGDSEAAQDRLRERLVAQATMTMIEMMQMNAGGMPGMDPTEGPFAEFEGDAAMELRQLLEGQHSAQEADAAYSQSGPLTADAAAVLQHGREFKAHLFDIYVDDSIDDKSAAVNAAVDEYLSDADVAVSSAPKAPSLLYGHPFAGAFRTGYPELSGLVWAGQWLELASLEPIMLGGNESTMREGVNTTLERYRSKIGGMPGMSMLPTEVPMVPAISPLLYSRHREAAVILDNLALLEMIIADLLVHPDVQDRTGSIDAVVDEFTNPLSNLVREEREYLLSALRGGIFNQGGPALGELARSERNRTRMEMEMPGHLVMPGMN